jgi:fumarylacetoacetase
MTFSLTSSMTLDATHDPALRSWVASANDPDTDFPIQNLPLGVFRRVGRLERCIGVAIGTLVLDLTQAQEACVWPDDALAAMELLDSGDLNALMAQGPAPRVALRRALSDALREGSPQEAALTPCLRAAEDIEMLMPCRIQDYSDFYAGIHHATAVGKLFRPDNPLLPNYQWVPIGYHGRASTIGVSGGSFHRPHGQIKVDGEPPIFAPCKRLDHELELGIFVGKPNAQGERIHLDAAEDHLFGVVLLNDWSARDIQAWEYQPLGPFLSKSFASTISPWVVTMEALAPFREAFVRPEGDPQPLPYLDGAVNRQLGVLNLTLETYLLTPRMQAEGLPPHRLMQSNFRDAYWTMAQLLTHQTSNGCQSNAGDLMGSGTLSGPMPGQGGSLLELTQGGKQPLTLPGGETRVFLQDGDTLILKAFAERAGARRIGLGSCQGTVLPARP